MSYESEILADAPLAYWRLGASPLDDTSGNGHTLTLLQGAYPGTFPGSFPGLGPVPAPAASLISSDFGAWPGVYPGGFPGPGDGSRDFDGTSQCYTIGSLPVSPSLTVEAWVSPDSVSSSAEIVSKDGGGFQFRTGDGGSPDLFYYYNDGSWQSVRTISGPLAIGQTAHVAVVDNGSTVSFYVNGTLNRTVTRPSVGWTVGSKLGIGVYPGDSGAPSMFFNGRIDEVAVYPTALSAARIAAHYRAGRQVALDSFLAASSFGATTQSSRKTFAQTTTSSTFAASTAGLRSTFDGFAAHLIAAISTAGLRTTFAKSSSFTLQLTDAIQTVARRLSFGQTRTSLRFAAQTKAWAGFLTPYVPAVGVYPAGNPTYPGPAVYPGRASTVVLTPLRLSPSIYGGLIPGFIPGSYAIPGSYSTGGISTLSLTPVVPLQGVYPGATAYPALYPGRGSVITLTQRSVVTGHLTPVLTLQGVYPGAGVYPPEYPGRGITAPLVAAASAVKTLTVVATPAGIFPGAGVYPGPAHYPGHGTTMRLVPEPVAA